MSDFFQRLLGSTSPASSTGGAASTHRGSDGPAPTGQLSSPLVNYDQRLNVDGFFQSASSPGVSPVVEDSDSGASISPSPFSTGPTASGFPAAPPTAGVAPTVRSVVQGSEFGEGSTTGLASPPLGLSDPSSAQRWAETPPNPPLIDGSFGFEADGAQAQPTAQSPFESPSSLGLQAPPTHSSDILPANNPALGEPVSPSQSTVQPHSGTLSGIESDLGFAQTQSTKSRPSAGFDGDTPAGTVSSEQAPVALSPASLPESLFASFEDAMMTPSSEPVASHSSEQLSRSEPAPRPSQASEVKHTVRMSEEPPEATPARGHSADDIRSMVNAALGGWLDDVKNEADASPAPKLDSDAAKATNTASAKPMATPLITSRTAPTPVDRLSAQSAGGSQPQAAPRLVIGQITVDMVPPAAPRPSAAPPMPTTAAAASKIGPIARRARR